MIPEVLYFICAYLFGAFVYMAWGIVDWYIMEKEYDYQEEKRLARLEEKS